MEINLFPLQRVWIVTPLLMRNISPFITVIIFLSWQRRTDVEELLAEIQRSEPLVTESHVDQVKHLLVRLQEKLSQQDQRSFSSSKVTPLSFYSNHTRDKIARYRFVGRVGYCHFIYLLLFIYYYIVLVEKVL